QQGYWFVKTGRQLNLFDPQGKWLANYHDLLESNIDPRFFSFFEEKNRLWLATFTGILKTETKTNPFQLIHQKTDFFSDCRNITEDNDGNIFFLNSELFHWDVKAQKLSKMTNSAITAYALIYADSIIWAGTYRLNPLGFEINLKTQKKTEYFPYNLERFIVSTVAKTDNPYRFLVSLNNGIAYLDLKEKKLLPFDGYRENQDKNLLLDQSLVNFIYRKNNVFWLASDHGIFLLNEQQGVLRHFSLASGDLPFDHIMHIYEDTSGFFWLATKGGGIIKWQPSLTEDTKSSYQQFTTDDILANNFTYAVYEDDYGKLWIPSDKGLMQLDKKTLQLRTFTTDDGLPHNEFNHTSHYQAKDGTFYFGGLGGLISFHPRQFAEESFKSTALEFIGYYVQKEGEKSMQDKTQLLATSEYLTLSPDDKFTELYFSLLDFDNVEKHRYSYKIEGYSDNWNEIKENFIRITHLPYGDYTLKVRGRNLGRGWSEKELSLKLHVLPPFYLQTWFLVTIFTLIIALTIGIIRWRLYSLRRDNLRLENEVRKRTQTILEQNEELKSLDKAKTRFFSNITHEFRTPLTLIIGPLDQLISNQPPPNILQRRMEGIRKNAIHLQTLINQLLDLSKIESGKMKIEVVNGDIIGYTQELCSRFYPMTDEKAQKLSFVSPLEKWEIHFDQQKWNKIIYNLVSNAVKFTPKGGCIQVAVGQKQSNQSEKGVMLRVSDTGVGIEKDQLSRIFGRFYQTNDSATRLQGGTGIGLALVKELVELQGGNIGVESQVNQGTTFEIYLPVPEESKTFSLLKTPAFQDLIPHEPISTVLHDAKTENRKKLELLIVEDNIEMCEYIRSCLDENKYQITESHNGKEGLEKALSLIPDLIISDVMMPEMDGFAFTHAIRNHVNTSHIPLILLTARASLESRLEGLRRGADVYLTKPFSPQELVIRIHKLIEIRQLLQKRYQTDIQEVTQDTYQQEDEFIMNIKGYILENLDEPQLNGDHIGREFAMSRVHLHRKLKALTSLSTGEFVKKIRLNEAEKLLQEKKYNISEIAYQTGFSSLSHFSREFKKVYGKAPSQV
ncbi:MAG: response regulator, partial [Bacteroidetes bacterium]|nr:response regulator [Bacteroidota bacterium]